MHSLLKHIFKPRSKLNAKLFRWQLHLQNYNFTVHYRKGAENIADFLSRIRHEQSNNNVHYKNLTNEYCNFIILQAIPKTLSLAEIQEHTKLHNTLNLVVKALKSNKWESDEVQSFKQIRNELTEHNSKLIHENRIVLPQSLQKKAIEIAHQGHLGICKVKSLLREKVYWPGLDADVNEFISRCIPCQANSRIPSPEPVKMSPLPEKVFEEISVDFYGPLQNGKKLLSIIDLYSRFPFIEIMKTTTAVKVIERLENVFAIYGYPEKLRHDKGPPFSSHEFKQHLKALIHGQTNLIKIIESNKFDKVYSKI